MLIHWQANKQLKKGGCIAKSMLLLEQASEIITEPEIGKQHREVKRQQIVAEMDLVLRAMDP